jgi:hypothetical protein
MYDQLSIHNSSYQIFPASVSFFQAGRHTERLIHACIAAICIVILADNRLHLKVLQYVDGVLV